MATSGAGANGQQDDGKVEGGQWFRTALSATASYVDAGSIGAIGAAAEVRA